MAIVFVRPIAAKPPPLVLWIVVVEVVVERCAVIMFVTLTVVRRSNPVPVIVLLRKTDVAMECVSQIKRKRWKRVPWIANSVKISAGTECATQHSGKIVMCVKMIAVSASKRCAGIVSAIAAKEKVL